MSKLRSLFNWEDIKVVTSLFIIMVVVFTAIMLYRAEYVDPIQDEHYSEIQGWED